mgnify:FL=1
MIIELQTCLDKINTSRSQDEASFVFCLWKEPLLFGEYDQVNAGNDQTIRTKDALFFYQLGRGMYDSGFRNLDSISVDTYLSDKADTRKAFTAYGGYPEVEKLKSLVNPDNVEAYFDRVSKLNTLSSLCEEFFKTFQDTSQFDTMSNSQVYDFFDYQLNSISMNSTRDMKVESVAFDESYITELDKGETVGLSYGKNCPRLNWATLGLPLGDLYMLGGFSGTGKTSFVFENMILPLTESGIKCCIISNEMQVRAYKQLLTIHILTNDLNYWKMTRKHLKVGKFNEEQLEMLRKAAAISQKKYSTIRFIKMFDNDTSRVIKSVRKYSKLGYQMFLWDTMKSDDDGGNMEMYRQLLQSSRKIFQCASRENVSIVCTYQLALYMKNQRFLDASTLSNGKQIKEVFSEMIYIRELWQDEYTGEKADCHAFTRNRKPDGTWEKFTTPVTLDKTKKYIVAFLDKTRNDEDGQQFLYEANLSWNNWKEVGYCTIRNDHVAIGR